MADSSSYDVIIVGGSYAGLAAAMAIGRAMLKVLVIDNGKPCNSQTPQSHNFLTNDGKSPTEIAAIANLQVRRYDCITFFDGMATEGTKTAKGFEIQVATGQRFKAKKLIFATGIKDILPHMEGIAACWGISVLHCPYCHGYEVKNEKTGILGNGETGFDFVRLIANWTKDLTLFTNGSPALTAEQIKKLEKQQVKIVEKKIEKLVHKNGYIQHIVFKDGTTSSIKALYAPGPFEQHCKMAASLGCQLTEEGYLKIDNSFETTIEAVFAIGDNASKMRTVANAVSMGTTAGMMISKQIIMNRF